MQWCDEVLVGSPRRALDGGHQIHIARLWNSRHKNINNYLPFSDRYCHKILDQSKWNNAALYFDWRCSIDWRRTCMWRIRRSIHWVITSPSSVTFWTDDSLEMDRRKSCVAPIIYLLKHNSWRGTYSVWSGWRSDRLTIHSLIIILYSSYPMYMNWRTAGLCSTVIMCSHRCSICKRWFWTFIHEARAASTLDMNGWSIDTVRTNGWSLSLKYDQCMVRWMNKNRSYLQSISCKTNNRWFRCSSWHWSKNKKWLISTPAMTFNNYCINQTRRFFQWDSDDWF